jgi:hypothetical protein
MAALRPRIGKEQIKCFNGFFGQQITRGVGNFDLQNANVFERKYFSTGLRDAARQFINSEKISLRITLRELAQERTIAASKIDLEWGDPPERRDEVDGREICLRDQFNHRIRMNPLRGDSTAQRQILRTNYALACFGVPNPIASITTAKTT